MEQCILLLSNMDGDPVHYLVEGLSYDELLNLMKNHPDQDTLMDSISHCNSDENSLAVSYLRELGYSVMELSYVSCDSYGDWS